MLKAFLPAAAVAALSFSAFAYQGPQPGDLALSDQMCHDMCDVSLDSRDDVVVACHGLCEDIKTCRADQSFTGAALNDCVSNANRKYALLLEGHSMRSASSLSEADKPVVTDADNSIVYGPEEGKKGFRDAI